MKNKNIYIIIIVLSAFIIYTGCKSYHQEESSPEEQTVNESGSMTITLTPEQYKNAEIKTGGIEHRKIEGSLQVNGLVMVPPQSKISVTFPYGGTIQKIEVLEGNYVRKGSLVAILANPEYIDLQENYLKNKSALEFARQEYERQSELFKADVAAGKAFQKSKSEYESLDASVKSLSHKLNILGIPTGTLTSDNIRSTVNIYAPDNGYVTKISANRGKFMDAREELLEINNIQNVMIALTVYEKDIQSVQTGDEILFTLSDKPQTPQKGRIARIGQEIQADRSIIAYAVPYDKNQRFIPGSYVQASILHSGIITNVLPAEAIVRSDGQQFIFVKETEWPYTFTLTPVKTGMGSDGLIQVTLPESAAISDSSIVLHGAFTLLSALRNTGDED